MMVGAFFLSIRWKIILLAALVLCASSGLLIWQQYRSEVRQFEQYQSAYRQQVQVLVQHLFELQAERLQIQARMFLALPNVREGLQRHEVSQLARDIEGLWSELSLEQGLSSASLTDSGGNILAGWGEPPDVSRVRLAQAAAIREAPMNWLDCDQACVFHSAIPVGYQGVTLGAMMVAETLENFIPDLRRLTGAEIGVLIGPTENSGKAEMQLLSASGGEEGRRLMRLAIGPRGQDGPLQIRHISGRTYQLLRTPAPVRDGVQAQLVFLNDVTLQMQSIRQTAQLSLTLGGVVLLLGLLLLYVMLRPTMQRIGHLTHLLPLLGREAFDEVRQCYETRPRSRFPDETDELEALALTLSDRLEGLRQEAREHFRAMANQATQLERERDLLNSLLNTAPILILSYGRDCRIRMANAAAQNVCVSGDGGVIGQNFSERFLDAWQSQNHTAELAAMSSGNVYPGESQLHCSDGTVRDIVWFHTRLAHESGETPTYLSVGMDVTEHRQIERQLNRLAEHDAVTGLLNRRAFKRELDRLLQCGIGGVMLVCDLDQFKVVNEAEGHEAGDAMLLCCAAHMSSLTPAPQLLARLGSDEFALVFPGVSDAEAIELAQRLNHIHPLPGALDAGRQALSTCVGIVRYPEHGAHADALLGSAQFALLQARDKGYGSWYLYTGSHPQRDELGQRAYWSREIEHALKDNRFVLHFQPIQEIASGKTSHYEALVRMLTPEGELVMPGRFIEVAESTGLIRRIDKWVIEAVVAFAADHPDLKVAFNLSARSFDDDLAFEIMREALKQHGMTGERMQMEITETAALANFTNAVRVMGKLRSLGCTFGLDDFGVGYSSFQYLKELPVDFVKIDGHFIRGLGRNPDDMVFVRALNEAVQGYGKLTVAEFVEDESALTILREIGVDCAQGYLIGRPAATPA